MAWAFLSVNFSYGGGRHIGETEADLTQKQIFTRVDNVKKDLVANPSSFRMAMSLSRVTGL